MISSSGKQAENAIMYIKKCTNSEGNILKTKSIVKRLLKYRSQ